MGTLSADKEAGRSLIKHRTGSTAVVAAFGERLRPAGSEVQLSLRGLQDLSKCLVESCLAGEGLRKAK